MAGICTNSTRINGSGCDHRSIAVALDGESIVDQFIGADLDAADWNDVIHSDWYGLTLKQLFVRLGIKYARLRGIALDDLLNRVTNGEEATNVKQYALLSKDVTKTNIGTAYVDIPPGANGERSLVDFTGCTEFRLIVNVNHITASAGQLRLRIVRDSDSAVLYESPQLSSAAGEKEADSASDPSAVNGWLPLPAQASGLGIVRFQGKSSVAADDPVFRRCVLLVR